MNEGTRNVMAGDALQGCISTTSPHRFRDERSDCPCHDAERELGSGIAYRERAGRARDGERRGSALVRSVGSRVEPLGFERSRGAFFWCEPVSFTSAV